MRCMSGILRVFLVAHSAAPPRIITDFGDVFGPVACMARGSSCNLSCSSRGRRSRGGRSSRVISIRKLQNQGFTELSLCFGFLVPCYSYSLMNDERIHHSEINEVVE